mgnify:FL=1
MAINDKQNEIQTEYSKLRKTLKNVPSEKIQMAEELIGNAAFMAVTLRDLQETIEETGPIVEYNHGKVESPAIKSYNTMINRYSGVMSQLLNLLPKDDSEKAVETANQKKLKQFIKIAAVK